MLVKFCCADTLQSDLFRDISSLQYEIKRKLSQIFVPVCLPSFISFTFQIKWSTRQQVMSTLGCSERQKGLRLKLSMVLSESSGTCNQCVRSGAGMISKLKYYLIWCNVLLLVGNYNPLLSGSASYLNSTILRQKKWERSPTWYWIVKKLLRSKRQTKNEFPYLYKINI